MLKNVWSVHFQVVRHFAQVIWKKAHKVGCARGELYGEPWYVVHYDSGPVLASPQIKENIGRPKQVCAGHILSTKVEIFLG